MDFEIALNQLASILFLPPGLNLLLALLGYSLLKKSKKTAITLFCFSLLSLIFLSLPSISIALNKNLQSNQALSQSRVMTISNANNINTAIVVLSGGRISKSPEYGDIDIVSSSTLQRLQYTAWLYRKTKLPILLSGGSLLNDSTSEAVLMNQTLLSTFNIAPKWLEVESKNTAQNAQYSAQILAESNITEILLITNAIHMQRAKIEFEKNGLKVIAAPTVFIQNSSSWFDYLPSAKALYQSQLALHEIIGRIWYSVRY